MLVFASADVAESVDACLAQIGRNTADRFSVRVRYAFSKRAFVQALKSEALPFLFILRIDGFEVIDDHRVRFVRCIQIDSFTDRAVALEQLVTVDVHDPFDAVRECPSDRIGNP